MKRSFIPGVEVSIVILEPSFPESLGLFSVELWSRALDGLVAAVDGAQVVVVHDGGVDGLGRRRVSRTRLMGREDGVVGSYDARSQSQESVSRHSTTMDHESRLAIVSDDEGASTRVRRSQAA